MYDTFFELTLFVIISIFLLSRDLLQDASLTTKLETRNGGHGKHGHGTKDTDDVLTFTSSSRKSC
jgi:hypothetical protein